MEQQQSLQNFTNDWNEYLVDWYQRNILFMDTMRKRGNDMVTMTTTESANVLTFPIEKILDGKEFERPINYWLARVEPLPNVPTDMKKRPYVVQDPRAGRGPGIAGFKKESEIGSALSHGHPVYFIGFDADPIDGQTYVDVIKGQVNFYQKVSDLHDKSPKLCAIGNCAAGYMTMFAAMQAPELFGPILIAGSPISYWNGKRGSGNPMRYGAGMFGGAWLISFLGDIGGGKFDGTNLVMNFNLLDFENFVWGKQYGLYANIDKESERFLTFERWLSSFSDFTREEVIWLTSNLFIDNLLTTSQLTTEEGISLDPRKITSPIITFVSDGDTISPPCQSAGWIADLYHNVDEIIAQDKTIVYCLNHKAGHLALFTGSKIANRENRLFVENMDSIDLLPPGLYELILETPEGKEGCSGEELEARYVTRTIDDIKKLGQNSDKENLAFATLAKASEAWLSSYNNFIHPLFKMYHQPIVTTIAKNMQPLRWSYWAFSEKYNPWIKMFNPLAEQVKSSRKKVNPENTVWVAQNQFAEKISKALKNIQQMYGKFQEETFFAVWGNPQVQKFWDTYEKPPRYTPSNTKLNFDKVIQICQNRVEALTRVNDELSALIRMIMALSLLRNEVTQTKHGIQVATVDYVIDWARHNYPKYSDNQLRKIIANQVTVTTYNLHQAIFALTEYLDKNPDARRIELLAKDIVIKLEKVSVEELNKIDAMIEHIRNEFK